MTIPDIIGYHHVTLTVSNLDNALAWYGDILGFEVLGKAEIDGLNKSIARRGNLVLTFVDHGTYAEKGDFTERRVGLDHLAFALANHDALEQWISYLDDKGITHSDIVKSPVGGELITFRDPDNIALEFYTIG